MTVTVLFLWGALSDERTGLSFTYAAALASVVFLRSESLGTRDHILLSQIWDFPFRRLLRVAGSRWRYSNPPPHRHHRKHITWWLLSQSIGALAAAYGKHMSRDGYPASPLASWLQPTENMSRDSYLLLWRRHCTCASCTDTKKTLLLYCWPCVCCGLCLAMDLHVTIL
jgi:hypothetical protein